MFNHKKYLNINYHSRDLRIERENFKNRFNETGQITNNYSAYSLVVWNDKPSGAVFNILKIRWGSGEIK